MAMKKVDLWPPPDWHEVVVLWEDIMNPPKYPIKQILDWIDVAPGGCYHLHGYKATEGFAFRFENSRDATYFRIMWL